MSGDSGHKYLFYRGWNFLSLLNVQRSVDVDQTDWQRPVFIRRDADWRRWISPAQSIASAALPRTYPVWPSYSTRCTQST